jgi:hypothetical protein
MQLFLRESCLYAFPSGNQNLICIYAGSAECYFLMSHCKLCIGPQYLNYTISKYGIDILEKFDSSYYEITIFLVY